MRPPDDPNEGLAYQPMLVLFQMEEIIFWVQFSILDSWMNTKYGSWHMMRFLRRDFFTFAPIPLVFHDKKIIPVLMMNGLAVWGQLLGWRGSIQPFDGWGWGWFCLLAQILAHETQGPIDQRIWGFQLLWFVVVGWEEREGRGKEPQIFGLVTGWEGFDFLCFFMEWAFFIGVGIELWNPGGIKA